MGRFIHIPKSDYEAFCIAYLSLVGEEIIATETDTTFVTHSFRVTPAHETALLADYPSVVFNDSEPTDVNLTLMVE